MAALTTNPLPFYNLSDYAENDASSSTATIVAQIERIPGATTSPELCEFTIVDNSMTAEIASQMPMEKWTAARIQTLQPSQPEHTSVEWVRLWPPNRYPILQGNPKDHFLYYRTDISGSIRTTREKLCLELNHFDKPYVPFKFTLSPNQRTLELSVEDLMEEHVKSSVGHPLMLKEWDPTIHFSKATVPKRKWLVRYKEIYVMKITPGY